MDNSTIKLPDVPFIRINDLATNRKAGRFGLLPMSKATIWNHVRKGSFPKPVKLMEHITAWRTTDIQKFIDSIGAKT